MKTVKVNASRNYEVLIGSGLIKEAGERISAVLKGKSAIIVSDDNVFPLYGETLKKSLFEAGIKTVEFVFPHGEQSKTLAVYSELLCKMYEGRLTRKDTVIALGGGVTGDLAGFAAATYQRGINFVQIPTSLLAAVDSSVGGKTGIDLLEGKNQVGAFYQPALVLCDTDTLETLPEKEYRNGCAEIIKYGMIGSRELLDSILAVPVKEQYEAVIEKCVSMKRDFVEADERDTGERMMLNFGHTIGHAVEGSSNYQISHGEAVAIGMAIITRAVTGKMCPEETLNILVSAIAEYKLPSETSYSAQTLSDKTLADKKRSGNTLTVVVPEYAGKCVLKEIPADSIIELLSEGGVK